MRMAKKASLYTSLAGLLLAGLWLGVFFGTGPYSPRSDIVAMEITYVVWHVLLYGGLLSFAILVATSVARGKKAP